MSEVGFIEKSTLEAIGSAVRNKEGTTDLIPVNTLADRISALPRNQLPQVIDGTVTEITAEDLAGATQIKAYAFKDCYSLKNITLPDSIKSIGRYAFDHCTKLTSITIPDGVTSIKEYTFSNCNNLTSITMPNSVTSIDNYAFWSCNFKSVEIPNGVISIGSCAFQTCLELESLIISNSVTSIGSYAFCNCHSLTSVTIGSGVKSISQSAFSPCPALRSLTIPGNVESIGSGALHIGHKNFLSTIIFLGTTPPRITTSTFDASKLEKIIVPKGCGETYKAATNWANFADFIEEATE